MLLKRIEAPTLQEALATVRSECGDDALLVETMPTERGYVVIAQRSAAATPPATPRAARATAPKKRRAAAPATRKRKWRPGFLELAKRGRAFGLDRALLRSIEQSLSGVEGLILNKPGDPAVPRVAAQHLAGLIETRPLPSARVTAFVGPTGVGKTTTLAKVAATLRRDQGASVAIVTIDTYRMAPVEQLRSMAEMIAAPFEVAFDALDLKRVVQRHASADHILIDTTGRSPFDRSALETLRATLRTCTPQIALCCPAASRRAELDSVDEAFRRCGDDRSLVLTKWDETRAPGEALSFAIDRGLPLSSITLGQEVPDDIVDADAAALAASAFAANEEEMEQLL